MHVWINSRRYLAKTAHLNLAQRGAHFLLLMDYYHTGKPIPDNDEILARIARLSLSDWSATRLAIAEFFVVRDGHWYHDDVQMVRRRRPS